MTTLSSDDLKRDTIAILHTGNLAQLSSKKVRKQLEEKYGTDLTDRRKEIDDIIMGEMAKQQESDNSSESDFDTPSPKNKNQMSPMNKNQATRKSPSVSSDDSMEDFVDDEPPAKKNKKSRPNKSPKEALSDAELAKRMQMEEEMVSSSSSVRQTRSGRCGVPPKSKKKADTEKKPRKGKGGEGFIQECLLSQELATVLGTDRMRRCDVVKNMWEIVRERNLLDPKNKSFMICDEQLYQIFKRKKVRMFGMMKYLTNHVFKPGELDDITC